MSKIFIVTGASRGIGLEIVRILLEKFDAQVVTLSRSSTAELQALKEGYSDRLEIVKGDVSSEEDQKTTLAKALVTFGAIDGLLLNAGIVDPQLRIEHMDISKMKSLFDINFFSLVSILKIALPHLRQTKGKVIFTSSGASTGNFTSWSAYNASKAAMNSLCRTLAAEEPDITAVAVRPGVVDTTMQDVIRASAGGQMSEKEHEFFVALHKDQKLVHPKYSAHVLAALAVKADQNLTGQFVNYSDDHMAPYQLSED